MLQLLGAPALSEFRIQKLLADLSTSGVDVTGWSLDSRFLHFVDTGVELTPAEAQVLASILTYGPMTQ
ncbi:MAG: hypothetical protein QNL99_01730, partial [SAR86 cluster bacterium]